MALAKIFTVSFVLGGIVSSAFSSTMSRGISRLQQLGQQEEKLKDKQKQLTASHAEATNELQQYQSKLSSLQARHNSCCMTYAQYNTELRNITENINRATANSRRYAGELQQVQRQLERTVRVKRATENFDNSSAGLSDAAASFGKTASAIGMLSAPLMGAVKYSMDFNAAMSKVKAITGATTEDMKKLTEQAELLGRTTPYTATQSAEAMTYLGMAGWNTTQIMAGMPSMLNLAVASGSDLATVADILSDDLTAFGMSAEQAAHMADVFAAASTNSNTNVEMMGETFKYAGAVAGALGYKLEDVAVATGLMASASIKGEQAGTSLRAIMNRLVAPPAAAAKAMDALGISVKNSDGSVKPFIETIKDLRTKFAGLSESEKAEKASAIAGTEAMSGFLAVVNASDADFNKLTNAINNADGACNKMAATMQDNLQGDLTNVQSAVQGAAIAVGNAFTPSLREAAKWVTEVATQTAKWAGEHQELIANLGKVAISVAGFEIGRKSFNVLLAAINATKDGIELLLARSQAARSAILQFAKVAQGFTWGNAIGKLVGICNYAKGALTSLGGKISSVFNSARVVVTGFIGLLRGFSIGGFIQGIASAMQGLRIAIMGVARAGLAAVFSPVGIAVMALAAAAYYCYNNWETVAPMFMTLWDTIQAAFSDAWIMLQPALQGLSDVFMTLWDAIQAAFADAWTMLQPALQGLYDAFGTLSAVVGENSGIFATLAGILGGAVVGAFITVATVAVNALATSIGVIASLVTGLMGVFTGLIQFITGVFTGNWTAAWEGVKNIFNSVFNTIANIADRVLGGIKNTLSSIGSGIKRVIGFGGGGGSAIAHNAAGGIYNKGAFLTTFAEEGPEAAIPLDGSPRAMGLWQRAGEILGMFPSDTPTVQPYRQSQTETVPSAGRYMEPMGIMAKSQPASVTVEHNNAVNTSRTSNNSYATETNNTTNKNVDASKTVNNNQTYETNNSTTKLIERFAPPPITINITVNGEAKAERIKDAVMDAGRQMQRSFAEQMEEFMHNRGRLSFG